MSLCLVRFNARSGKRDYSPANVPGVYAKEYVSNSNGFRRGFLGRLYLNFRLSTILIIDAFFEEERERERGDSSPAAFTFPRALTREFTSFLSEANPAVNAGSTEVISNRSYFLD